MTALTSESQVDWAMIEGLRQECMEWAGLQEEVRRLAAEAQKRTQNIREMEKFLHSSGYQGLSEEDVQRLRRAEEERDAALEELDKLRIITTQIAEKQIILAEELARLQAYTALAEVTEADEIKIARRERHLGKWQSSTFGNFLDRVMRKQFDQTNIAERLASRLNQDYQSYNVSNYTEFSSQLREFRSQRQVVEKLQMELEWLEEKVSRVENLVRIEHSRAESLKQAFLSAKVPDFPTWLKGWEDYQQKKHQLDLWLDEQRLGLKQLENEEKKMAASAVQLREKLGNWGTLATDRDEVLAACFASCRPTSCENEAERELSEFSQTL